WSRRHKAQAAAIGLAAGLLLTVAIGSTAFALTLSKANAEILKQRNKAVTNEKHALKNEGEAKKQAGIARKNAAAEKKARLYADVQRHIAERERKESDENFEAAFSALDGLTKSVQSYLGDHPNLQEPKELILRTAYQYMKQLSTN